MVPAYGNTEDRVDGPSAVHTDFVDQGLEQGLDRGWITAGQRLGHPVTERRQFLARWGGQVGLVHFVRQHLTTGS